jgi:beta-carotene 3-hydroxylase
MCSDSCVMCMTFQLCCIMYHACVQFGMEMYARFAHKVLWHDFEPGWALHKSHHMPRTGPFEANDIYAIINGES